MATPVTPHEQGFTAYERGQPKSQNPHPRNSYDWTRWIDGFEDAEGFAFKLTRAMQESLASRKHASSAPARPAPPPVPALHAPRPVLK